MELAKSSVDVLYHRECSSKEQPLESLLGTRKQRKSDVVLFHFVFKDTITSSFEKTI